MIKRQKSDEKPGAIGTNLLAMAVALFVLQGCAAPPVEKRVIGISGDDYNRIVQECDYEAAKAAASITGFINHDEEEGIVKNKCIGLRQNQLLEKNKKGLSRE